MVIVQVCASVLSQVPYHGDRPLELTKVVSVTFTYNEGNLVITKVNIVMQKTKMAVPISAKLRVFLSSSHRTNC